MFTRVWPLNLDVDGTLDSFDLLTPSGSTDLLYFAFLGVQSIEHYHIFE